MTYILFLLKWLAQKYETYPKTYLKIMNEPYLINLLTFAKEKKHFLFCCLYFFASTARSFSFALKIYQQKIYIFF